MKKLSLLMVGASLLLTACANDNGCDAGYCKKGETYLGQTIEIEEYFNVAFYDKVEYVRFAFEEDTNYAFLIAEDITHKYSVMNDKSEMVYISSLSSLKEENAYSVSVDKYIYVTLTFVNYEKDTTEGRWCKVKKLIESDQYGFDANGNYVGEEAKKVGTYLYHLFDFETLGYQFKYPEEYRSYGRLAIEANHFTQIRKLDYLKIIKTYVREVETHNMVEIDIEDYTVVLDDTNKDTYEHYVYVTCELKTGQINVDYIEFYYE